MMSKHYFQNLILSYGDIMAVLFKNSDITIYNHYIDKTTKLDKYKRTVITDVNWNSKKNMVMSDKGTNIVYTTVIILDKLDNYINERDFYNLEDKTGYFTLALGDKIVKNAIDFEVTRIAELSKAYEDVVTIMSIRENKIFKKLEVECK